MVKGVQGMAGRRWRKGLGILGGLLFGAVAVELGLSWKYGDPPVDRRPGFVTVAHSELGYALVPGQRTYTYQAEVRTNQNGLRERPFEPESWKERRRIVCLGGSETFGKGVLVQDTFPRRLEDLLGETQVPKPVVINAGVPDYNMQQSLLWLARYGLALKPHIVVLSLYWDDLFFDPTVAWPPTKNVATKSTSGKASLDTLAPVRDEWFLRRWARTSGVLDWISPLYTRSRTLYFLRNLAKLQYGRWKNQRAVVWRDLLLSGSTNAELEAAFARADEDLERFSQWAKQENFTPFVLVLPIEFQIESGVTFEFQRRVTAMATKHSLQVVDPWPLMKEEPSVEAMFIPFDGRPSSEGHAVLAQALAAALK